MSYRQHPTRNSRPATRRRLARLFTLTLVLLGLAVAAPAGGRLGRLAASPG